MNQYMREIEKYNVFDDIEASRKVSHGGLEKDDCVEIC